MVTSRLVIYALSAIAIFRSPLTAAQAASKYNPDTRSELAVMQALLAEVRQLHQAVKHMAVVNGRAQLTVQQMQLQEQRLNHASLQLDDIRKQIDTLSAERTAHVNGLANLESHSSREQDTEQLRMLEDQKAGFKSMIEQFTLREAQLRSREADATIRLENEQARWQELSYQLSALNQSLESDAYSVVPTEQKTPEKSK